MKVSTYLETIDKWVKDGMTKEQAVRTYREVHGLCLRCGADPQVWHEVFDEEHNCNFHVVNL